MNICVVSGTFHPEPGGPPAFLYRLLPELVRRGHTVEVVTYGEADAPRDYPYRVTRISRRRPIPLRLPALARAVLAAGRRADIFLVSDYGLPVALVNLWLRKPVILRLVADFAWEFCQRHGWIPETQTVENFQAASHPWRVKLLRLAQVFYARSATRLIVPSEHVARLARGWGLSPQVVYNAVDGQPFANLPSRRRDLTVVTVARLTPVKGADVVIRAFAQVRTVYPQLRLVIIGDGPARADLESLCRDLHLGDSACFTGTLSIDSLANYLGAAGVFALGSRTEGLPHAVLEAMAAGAPVVATRVGGTPEVVTDGVNGLLVPPDDPPALAAAITGILENPARARRLAQAGRETLDRFSWLRLVDEYEAALLGVLKR